MEVEHWDWIATVVALGLVVVTATGAQIAVLEVTGDSGYQWNKGQNYKIAGIFRIADQGENSVLDYDKFEEDLRRSGENDVCIMDLPGFRDSEPLAVDFTPDSINCPDSHEAVSAPVYTFFPDKEGSVETLYVGGKNER